MLIAFNKPYGVICKFSPEPGKRTLAEFIDVPRVYPADTSGGRFRCVRPMTGSSSAFW